MLRAASASTHVRALDILSVIEYFSNWSTFDGTDADTFHSTISPIEASAAFSYVLPFFTSFLRSGFSLSAVIVAISVGALEPTLIFPSFCTVNSYGFPLRIYPLFSPKPVSINL